MLQLEECGAQRRKRVGLDRLEQREHHGTVSSVGAVSGELLFFLDDDARLPGADTLARVAARLAEEPDVGLLHELDDAVIGVRKNADLHRSTLGLQLLQLAREPPQFVCSF